MSKASRALAGVVYLLLASSVSAQQRRTTRRTPARSTPPVTEPAVFQCPSPLGAGASSQQPFCDVVAGRDPADGIVIELPPHTGDVTLMFDLHNRHTYSEDLVKAGKAYWKYTSTIGVLTADNTLLARAVVQNEFRVASDIVERITGGAGPGGLKAVAPTGAEAVTVVIPAAEVKVSILGEKLSVISPERTDTFLAPGRPVAIVSNVRLTYSPKKAAVPARKAPARAPGRAPATAAPKR
ncbi:MAG: hypothetical protein Q7J25_00130 [Vicinamibacterales bacterium]|nr:hypothetical protein [Vicinamibacterales bacterium]